MADVLELLIAERDRLDQAIAVLQGPRRRGRPPGRPPGSVKKATTKVNAKKERKRRAVSAEARKRMSEAQRKRWAAQKKVGKKAAKKSS